MNKEPKGVRGHIRPLKISSIKSFTKWGVGKEVSKTVQIKNGLTIENEVHCLRTSRRKTNKLPRRKGLNKEVGLSLDSIRFISVRRTQSVNPSECVQFYMFVLRKPYSRQDDGCLGPWVWSLRPTTKVLTVVWSLNTHCSHLILRSFEKVIQIHQKEY